MARSLRVMRIILTAATVALCLLLCWQAVDIYLTGNSPDNFSAPGVRISPVYSWEIVGSRFETFAPVFFVYLALVAAGLILQAAAGERPRPQASFLAENQLRTLYSRAAQIPPEAAAERRRRRTIRVIAGAVAAVCSVPAAIYLLNPKNFSDLDLETVVGSMLLHVAPWGVLALAAACAASVLNGQSVLREVEILKSVPKKQPEPHDEKRTPLFAPRLALYAVAAVFIVLGVVNGGLWDVLVKAVNICTECIGLG